MSVDTRVWPVQDTGLGGVGTAERSYSWRSDFTWPPITRRLVDAGHSVLATSRQGTKRPETWPLGPSARDQDGPSMN